MAAAAARAWRAVSAGGLDPSPDGVDVVACGLDVPPPEVQELRALLAPDELARARRLRTDHLRDAFVVGRGRLRQILGVALGCPPPALRLGVDAGGKPRLDGPEGKRLRFNATHSRGLMLCAVTLDHAVGIDVEYVSPDVQSEELAARFLAPAEQGAIAALPAAARRGAFVACWTRKEAVLKATGDGLRRSLHSFAVSVPPRHAEVLACDPALGRPDAWSLAALPVGPDYHGTVAVRGGRRTVSVRLWSWGRG
jgi:4'-phosphopantetheinyl transferase